MVSKAQMNGMRGVYLAAAELARLGFITSPTSRSAAGADILATTHDCNRAYSVQVKTKTTKDPSFLLGRRTKSIKSSSHFYVLVHIRQKKLAAWMNRPIWSRSSAVSRGNIIMQTSSD